MEFNYKPLGNKVVILRDKAEEKTAGGIFIPDSAQDKPTKGTVIATNNNSELTVGDKVIYSKFAGSEITIDKTTYLLLKDDDILLIEQ